jgi:DNA helicase-2/ATP-dependent DNA helicase PcrA
MVTEQQVLDSNRCSIIAPAGCGKTELIVRCIQISEDKGKFLVLTHTHAGVRALRSRFKKNKIDPRRFKIETIAGWCLSYTTAYPVNSGIGISMPSGPEWNQVYQGAIRLVSNEYIKKVLQNSYLGVFVDEYQDCNLLQHTLITKLAEVLPCRVLGDPLQGIFGFAGSSLSWSSVVEAFFPPIGVLDYPWRWEGKNPELGRWLLQIRGNLISGQPIDLNAGPITWLRSTPENQRSAALGLLRHNQSVITIKSRPAQAHDFARNIGRAYVSMEEMECKDLMQFMDDMDVLSGFNRPLRIIEFAKLCISGVSPHLSNFAIAFSENRIPALSRIREESKKEVLKSLIYSSESNDHDHIWAALLLIEKMAGIRIFRKELWQEAKNTLKNHSQVGGISLSVTAWSTRNKSRFLDRNYGYYAVSRTLLIKGLEFDHAIIPSVEEMTGSDAAKQFYVAMTRGCYSLTVLSENSTVQFPPAVI